MKRWMIGVCLLGLLLCGCGQTEELPDDTAAVSLTQELEADKLVYVSLGDSIARGYGLTNLQEERFSTIAAERWDGDVEVYNYGVDGQTSSQLIAMLENGNAAELAEADVVSVSIGANNVLKHMWQFLYDYTIYLYADPVQITDTEIAEGFRAFTAAADEGCRILEEDVPLLMETIRRINPDCDVLFLTLYNPYEAVNTELRIDGLPISFAALSDTYVRKINECIRDGTAEDENTKIVDVYSAFAGRADQLVCAYTPEGMSPLDLDMSTMDPHPNAMGHKVIGGLVGEAFTRK